MTQKDYMFYGSAMLLSYYHLMDPSAFPGLLLELSAEMTSVLAYIEGEHPYELPY